MSSPHCRWIGLNESDAWRDALLGLPHGFEHRPEFSLAASLVSGNQAGLWVCEGARGRAACPLLIRSCPGGGFDIVTPPGFSGFCIQGDLPELGQAWTADWRARGAIAAYVQLSPLAEPARWRELLPSLSSALYDGPECWVWNLLRPVDELMSGMYSKHRQLLHKWLREEASVVWDQAELLPRFKSLHGEFIERQQVGAAYRYTSECLDLLARAPGAFLVGARGEDGSIEAITLFLSAGRQSTSLVNAASVPGRRHSRGLYWSGALRLRDSGVETLNLGGGLINGDSLAQFKQRLGSECAPTLVLKQVLDAESFELCCAQAGVPSNAGALFPPWLATSR